MKVDVTQTFKTLSGKMMKDVGENGEPVDATLRLCVVNSLLAPVQKESGIDKVKKYELAKRVYQNDVVELTTEEIALIKNRIGEAVIPIVVGQAFDMLEGK